jgi:hypothetical protein
MNMRYYPTFHEGAIKNGKSRETGNLGYTRGRKTHYFVHV